MKLSSTEKIMLTTTWH